MRKALIVSAIVAVTVLGVFPTMSSASGRSWGAPQVVETSEWGWAYNPQVAMDASGNAIVVWEQWDGSHLNIYSKRYIVGDGWGETELAETDDSGNAVEPRLAVDSSGNSVAVWMVQDPDSNYREDAWANRYVVGMGWGTAQPIETDVSGDAKGPEVAVDSSGNAIAVWYQENGSLHNIMSNRYVAGAGWGTAERIEFGNIDCHDPKIAIDSTGNAVVVWNQGDLHYINISSSRYVVGTGWGAAHLIEDDYDTSGNPQVAVDDSGNAIAVWASSAGTRSNRYVEGIGWGTDELIGPGNSSQYPQVAIDGLGNAVAVWEQHGGAPYETWSNRYVDGTGWGTAELIGADNSANASRPQVSADGLGNAVAVWSQPNGINGSVWSNQYVVGTGWGTVQLISDDDLGYAYYPQVAVDVAGNAIAVWFGGSDETHDSILSNRYAISDESSELPLAAIGVSVIAVVAVAIVVTYVVLRRKQPPKEQQQA